MKVVDCRTTVRDVFLFAHVDDGLGIRVVHCLSGIPSVRECASDPYGPDGIQPIGVLYDLASIVDGSLTTPAPLKLISEMIEQTARITSS